jgi:WD40 repeat protein
MGIVLVAIVWLFTQAEGCGIRYTMIETLSFSSDDSRILVAKLSARNARTPWKLYKANVSRTLSWLDVPDGGRSETIHQDFEPGNCGTARRMWHLGRTSALCNPSNDHIAMSAFGGGDVTCGIGAANARVVPLKHRACNIAYSTSGRFLAASGMNEVTVLDARTDTVAMQFHAIDPPFLAASLMSFTFDDTRIAVACDSGVHVWDIATCTRASTILRGHEPHIHAIAAAPGDTLIVCSEAWVRRYDFAGQIVASLGEDGRWLCSVSADGRSLAVSGGGKLEIYDLNSNNLRQAVSLDGATALALSSDGSEVAVGLYNGRVALLDGLTGARRWQANPPSRYRWPWTLPALLLVVWICLAWRLSMRPKTLGGASCQCWGRIGKGRGIASSCLWIVSPLLHFCTEPASPLGRVVPPTRQQ